MKDYYYLSTGGEGKIYTLRYFEGGGEYEGKLISQSDYHVKNLAIDYDEAIAKGKLYADGLNASFKTTPETNLTEYGVYGVDERTRIFDGETLNYGQKYFGWKILDIIKEEKEFGIKYLAEQWGLSANKSTAQVECLAYIKTLPEIIAYTKTIEDEEKARTAEDKKLIDKYTTSKWVGVEGEKITTQVTILNMFSFDGMYGESWIIKMQDKKGNIFITFTSGKIVDSIEKGMNAEITGTIKSHNMAESHQNSDLRHFNDFQYKETQLARIKLIKIDVSMAIPLI